MASLATEVSLHCMICYEEFNIRDRAPVVLPCGHTYICEVCAKRLKKCMECREPLFWTPPPPSNKGLPALNMNSARSPQTLRYGGGGARNRYSPGPQTPPHPSYTGGGGGPHPPQKEEPIPLPLPRNTVLMEMIESAERQARLIAEQKQRLRAGTATEEDDALIEPTLAGRTALAGACGTYAVKEPLGLAVLPFDPNLRHDGRKEPGGEEKKTEEAREPFTIEDGQTVQVVAEEDGVYQLARGVGFIVASVNQLVKVGRPLEKSCRLEGMLDSVVQKQMQLQKELDEIDLLANGLREQIKEEHERPEEHPVISARKEAPKMNDENDNAALLVERTHPATPPQQNSTDLQLNASTDSTEVELGFHQTPVHPQRNIYENSPARSCPMPMTEHRAVTDDHLQQPFMDEQSTGLPRYRISNDDNELGLTGSLFGCGSALFGERLLELDGNSRNLLEGMNSMVLSFDDEEATLGGRSHNTARTTDDSTYSRSMPSRTGSFDGVTGVNFRTGMSGHRGLTQVKKKASPGSNSRREIRMMSDHRGVGHVRGNQKEHHVHPRTYIP